MGVILFAIVGLIAWPRLAHADSFAALGALPDDQTIVLVDKTTLYPADGQSLVEVDTASLYAAPRPIGKIAGAPSESFNRIKYGIGCADRTLLVIESKSFDRDGKLVFDSPRGMAAPVPRPIRLDGRSVALELWGLACNHQPFGKAEFAIETDADLRFVARHWEQLHHKAGT
jgi:hypothetical protein